MHQTGLAASVGRDMPPELETLAAEAGDTIMSTISATTAHTSAHASRTIEKAQDPDPSKDTNAQASKRSEEKERAQKIIDSRPSQAQINFQQSLHTALSASDAKNF